MLVAIWVNFGAESKESISFVPLIGIHECDDDSY